MKIKITLLVILISQISNTLKAQEQDTTGRQLKEVTITESKGYQTKYLSESSRITGKIFEIPQNIVVISQRLIQDQQAFTPTDLSRNVSGVNSIFPFPGVYTDFNIRGTRATQGKFRNGMNMGNSIFGMLQEDMSYTEGVEFIKGPAPYLLGQGEPGGVFNVVTKKPTKETIRTINLSSGSFNLYRVHGDISGGVGKAKKLTYRLNVMGQMNNTHIDNQASNRLSIAPVLAYEITPKTTITAEYNYDIQRTNGLDMAIPSIGGKFELPRSFNISNIDDKLKFQQEYVFTQLKHAFNDDWKVTAQFSYNEGFLRGYDVQSRGVVFQGDSVAREARYWDNNANNKNAQVFVNGRIKITENIGNDLYAGADLGEQYFKRLAISGVNSSGKILPNRFSLRNPNYASSTDVQKLLPKPEDIPFQVPAVTRFKAINLYNTTKFGQYVHLTWGGRYNWIETGTVVIKPDEAFTPRLGLSIFPTKNLNIYALRDQTFLPVAGTNKAGEEFKPQQGLNYEVGLKKQWFDGALSTNVAWFNITKTNGLTADPVNVGFQIQQLEVQSQGIEFDIIGSPIPALSIIANYAYTDSRISKDRENSKIIGRWEQAPLHIANVWVKYTLENGTFKGLGFATGYSYLGSRKTLTIGLTDKVQQVELPDFKKLDVALSYQTGIFNFALNIDNLTSHDNIYGTYDLRNRANVFNYLTTPGINWRLGVGIRL